MAALLGLIAHGGIGGAVVEAAAAILIVAVALAVWVANRSDGDSGDAD
ncbi:MAG: hypothetical protein M3310_04155 [Actinomycetota bacterium]|nr:hypothetical protein [Actinomycetota bacterium]